MKPRSGDTPMPLLDPPPSASAAAASRRRARDGIEPKLGRLQSIVLHALTGKGPRGLTDEELAHETGIKESTCRARRIELTHAQLVRDSGKTRPLASGLRGTVWIANSAAQLPSSGPPAAPTKPPAARGPARKPPKPTPPPPAAAPTRPADRKPTRPCYCCGSRAFWSHRLSPAVWLRATCRRPIDESHVAERFALPEENA